MADRKENSSRNNKNQSRNHNFRKRPPQKPEIGENVLFISTKTNIKAQLERCKKLINNNESEIIIYCLGAAIQRGILLALQLCEHHVAYKIYTNTLSTELIDDLEPAVDDADYDIQKRFNSALRIRIFRSDPLETPEKKAN
ncbi:ribonuclease P protein subunit p20 [Anoplophora glabripennis]|uniref:ribonuclease P protein subunit p20 n=1 Tax=Anoplophora glabripennis TaxID=217634 RepID=UPI0008758550|nr:ribonuclease P protein subunit p20 [Anoplophora glabripennis]